MRRVSAHRSGGVARAGSGARRGVEGVVQGRRVVHDQHAADAMHEQLLAFFRQSQRVQKATPQVVPAATEPDASDPYDN